MNTRLVRSLGLAAALLAGMSAMLFSAEPRKEEAALSSKLITAIERSDYEAFVADGEPAFKSLNKEQFAAVAAQMAPRLQAGYEISYLGELRQQGYHVTLWKVSYKDRGDDALATLSVRDGKVGGFYIR